MLTIFSTAKRFEGLFATIQRNAIQSWTLLEPRPEIIMFGDDAGTAELCDELGLHHVPDVATNEFGTPLVADMFERAQALATGDVCCFINADVILLPETMATIAAVQRELGRFLVVGQRRDVDQDRPLDFGPGWADSLRARAARDGELMSQVWIDYFIFPTGAYPALPPFAMGRSGYDNWLIWRAAEAGLAVVDATPQLTVVHQRHDYSHGGGKAAVWEGPEARRQQAMIGHWSRFHSVAHARYMLVDGPAVVPARGLKYRLARPRRLASHALRFTRPVRRRLKGERATLRRVKA